MTKHEHRCHECGKVYPCWGRKRARCPGPDQTIGKCLTCRSALKPLSLEEEIETRAFLLGFEPETDER